MFCAYPSKMYGKLSKWIKVLKKTCDIVDPYIWTRPLFTVNCDGHFNVTHGAWFNTGDFGWLRCE